MGCGDVGGRESVDFVGAGGVGFTPFSSSLLTALISGYFPSLQNVPEKSSSGRSQNIAPPSPFAETNKVFYHRFFGH